jgi:hypothetical protein
MAKKTTPSGTSLLTQVDRSRTQQKKYLRPQHLTPRILESSPRSLPSKINRPQHPQNQVLDVMWSRTHFQSPKVPFPLEHPPRPMVLQKYSFYHQQNPIKNSPSNCLKAKSLLIRKREKCNGRKRGKPEKSLIQKITTNKKPG